MPSCLFMPRPMRHTPPHPHQDPMRTTPCIASNGTAAGSATQTRTLRAPVAHGTGRSASAHFSDGPQKGNTKKGAPKTERTQPPSSQHPLFPHTPTTPTNRTNPPNHTTITAMHPSTNTTHITQSQNRQTHHHAINATQPPAAPSHRSCFSLGRARTTNHAKHGGIRPFVPWQTMGAERARLAGTDHSRQRTH